MYDLIIEMAHTLWKNGFSLTALGTAVFVLLKQRKVKKRLRRYIPWLLEDDSEVKAYIHNQHLIMERLGIEWNGPESITTPIPTNLNKSYQLSWGVKRMKNKLKSRKFWLAILGALLVIANETFDLGLSAESQATIVVILVSFILGESAVDAKRAGKDKSNDNDFETPIEPRV
jgi:uncharacterized membrane protein